MKLPWESNNLPVTIAFGFIAMAVLVLSSNEAVRRLIRLSGFFNVSTTFMGVTILSVATSIPEISSHLVASVGILRKTLDYRIGSAVVLGANIGSDVVQQTLILAMVVFAAGTLYFRRYFLWKTMIPMVGTTIQCLILGWDRQYSRLDGFILLATFVGYTAFVYWDERKYYRKEDNQREDTVDTPLEALRDSALAVVMMALTIISAQIVLGIAEHIVVTTGVGGSLIGVVTLGVASALPELTTAISGIRQGDTGIPLGTLVGSNITNPLLAIGAGALISTYWVPAPLIHWDLPWEAATGAILWIIIWIRKGKLGRLGAFYLGSLYFAYIILRAVFFSAD